jgi:carbonic anhydrase
LQAGSANATIRQVWQHMPMSEGKEQRAKSRRLPASTFIPQVCCPATPPIICPWER